MNRKSALKHLQEQEIWDVIVIGGGASGLGAALDAVSRGFKTLLIEKQDFSGQTSSKSSKLIHGGIRYLKQGHLKLIKEALKERAYLLKKAPHLVQPLPFIIPTKNLSEKLYYFLGMKMYDFLSLGHAIKPARLLNKDNLNFLPSNAYSGGIEFFDAKFDDARLAITTAQTIVDLGGTVINYLSLTSFIKDQHKKLIGINAKDELSNKSYILKGKVIINAAGAFADQIRLMDDNQSEELQTYSQGAHILLDASFFPYPHALVIPATSDDRLIFIIPWHNKTLIGTTDIPLSSPVENPRPLFEEVDFLMKHSEKMLAKKPTNQDILSAYAGIRALVKSKNESKPAKNLSREHLIVLSSSNLISIIGGKWTTFRSRGQEIIDKAIHLKLLPNKQSTSSSLALHGFAAFNETSPYAYYGSDLAKVEELAASDKKLLKPFHPELPLRPVDVIWAMKKEMAHTVDDILLRRTRCKLLNQKLAEEITPAIENLIKKNITLNWSLLT